MPPPWHYSSDDNEFLSLSRVISRATSAGVCPCYWTRPHPQTANGPLCDIIITRTLAWCIYLSAKIKGTDAGVTSRALPTGNRSPLKAWQGRKKKQNLSSVGFFGRVVMSPVGESGSSLFIFHPSFFNHSRPSVALRVIIEKTVQLFFVSSWQYLQ